MAISLGGLNSFIFGSDWGFLKFSSIRFEVGRLLDQVAIENPKFVSQLISINGVVYTMPGGLHTAVLVASFVSCSHPPWIPIVVVSLPIMMANFAQHRNPNQHPADWPVKAWLEGQGVANIFENGRRVWYHWLPTRIVKKLMTRGESVWWNR